MKSESINKPFPQQQSFIHAIKPNHISQAEMNEKVANFYNTWKKLYLREAWNSKGYFIAGESTNASVPTKGTSEGQGFGMIVFALMAGYDNKAKEYYDGLFEFFSSHRSNINHELMGWSIAEDEREWAFNSATDGDIDIAYSLLLAHTQWGSKGDINYLDNAIKMITYGIKESCIDHKTNRIKLGDWDTLSGATRSSDWMTAQTRAFGYASGDDFWMNLNNSIYEVIETIKSNHSPETGLMPDFIVGTPARPADDNFLEKSTDKDFSWNACRYPWRITMDFVHYKIQSSRQAAEPIVSWIRKETNEDPSKIKSSYTLDGKAVEQFSSNAFIAPMLVACMISNKNQNYLNKGWDVISSKHSSYYDDSITLLCLLMISGNWWKPAI